MCGVDKFCNENNMCSAESNINCTVLVRHYADFYGRSRGIVKEITEKEMNGEELIQWLIECLKKAIPHRWDDQWGAHARQLYLNTSDDKTATIMTDFAALTEHGVQDAMNTTVLARSNQSVLLVSHSPRHIPLSNGIMKRVQENDVWHFWSAVGGTLETNSYHHRVVIVHTMTHYSYLNIERWIVFTDGCAEQYKNRRIAWLLA